MESVTEVWRPVTVNSDYEVSNAGAVRSLSRLITRPNRWGMATVKWSGRVLRPGVHQGYRQVKLGACKTVHRVHQLVAWAFNSPQPVGTVVNHIDGNKLNNTPGNLEYITNSENVKHAYRTGLLNNSGVNNGRSRARRLAAV